MRLAWLFYVCRVPVTVAAVYRDDVEVPAAKGGENLRLRLTGIDEEDLAAGFVVCSRNAVVPAVTYFNAQLQVRSTYVTLTICLSTQSSPWYSKLHLGI